jgi:hypothetical protein
LFNLSKHSIGVVESMDVDGVAQIAVYIRGCYSKFSTEELLELIPMHVVTTGEDIFCKVERLFQKCNCH